MYSGEKHRPVGRIVKSWTGFVRVIVVGKTCILQYTPLLITNGLYQQVKLLSVTLVTNSAVWVRTRI